MLFPVRLLRRGDTPEHERRLSQIVAFNTSAQVLGFAISSLAGLASVTVAARYLGTTPYGYFATASAFVSLFQLISDFGIEPVATRELVRQPEHRPHLLATVFVVGSLTNIVGGLLSVAFGIAFYSQHGPLLGAIAILAAQTVFGGGRLVANATANRQQKAYLTSLANTGARVISLLFTILAVALGWGLDGVVAAQVIYAGIRTLWSLWFVRSDLRDLSRPARGAGRQLLRSAAPMGLVSAVSFVYFRLDLLLISFLRDTTDVALYGLSYKVIEVLMSLPGFVLVAVLPVLSVEDSVSNRFATVLKKTLVLMQCMAGAVGGLAVLAPEIVITIGGPQFRSAGPTMILLFVALALMFIQNVFGYALVALGRQSQVLKVSLVVLVVNLVVNLVLIPVWGIEGAGVALICSELFSVVAISRLLPELPWTFALPNPRFILALSVYLGTLALSRDVLKSSGTPDSILIVAAGLISTAAYAGAIFGLKVISLQSLKTDR